MTLPSAADVVVIGAGHNGLVAACYLARAGLSVEVVERDDVVGGAVSTVSRFPGYQVDRGSSLHVMVRWTGIIEELGLERFGLRYLDCDPWGFFPVAGASGGGITFRVDLARTCASIEAVCGPAEADAYHSFVTDWVQRTRPMVEAFNEPPTPARIGRAAWRAGRHLSLSGMEISRQFLSAGDAVLDESLRDERLKTALAWMGAQSGAPMSEPGTAGHLGWSAMLHEKAPGRPVGGSGGLTKALAARLESDGGRLRLGDGARAIRFESGRASEVETTSGERIRTRNVIAACHVLTTLDLASEGLPAALRERASRAIRVGNGVGVALRLGTRALPDYPDAPPDVHAGLGLLAADRKVLAAARGDHLAGRAPKRPPIVVMGFSALDPGLAPAQRHSMSIWAQWYPYELARTGRTSKAAGGWKAIRDDVTATLLAQVDEAAPGFSSSVEHAYLQTPEDLERELGLHRGNVMHIDMCLPAMFGWRPLPELSGYRTPAGGLYLAGASTHPGGGVSGASGRSAARVLLADLEAAASGRLGQRLGGLRRRVGPRR